MANIRIDEVTKKFGSLTAVNHLSLEIKHGEMVAFLGPSGAGKTTTFRMLAGVEEQDDGNIYIDDELVNDVPPQKRDVAMMFQSYALYPNKNVYENLSFPLKLRGQSKTEIDNRVKETAKILKIDHLLTREVTYLSGGERQRVALGGALVRQPKIYLLDEPLTNLDAKLRLHMRKELKNLQKMIGQTTLMATPDQLEAFTMADRIAVLNKGNLQQYDTISKVYNKPSNTFVADFTGSPGMNLIECSFVEKDKTAELDAGEFQLDFSKFKEEIKRKAKSPEVILGVRPTDIYINTKQQKKDDIKGEVYVREPTGQTQIIDVKIGQHIIKAEASIELICKMGDTLFLSFNKDKLHVFDKKSGELII